MSSLSPDRDARLRSLLQTVPFPTDRDGLLSLLADRGANADELFDVGALPRHRLYDEVDHVVWALDQARTSDPQSRSSTGPR